MSSPISYSPRRKLDYSSRRDSSSSNSSIGSPQRKDKNDFDLPDFFGKEKDDIALKVNDERSVLEQMRSSAYKDSPLHSLSKYLVNDVKVKIWTRSHNSIRGLLFGYIICFDKHWNLIMRDCVEVFCKTKKSKTPFLRNVTPNENLMDFPVKVTKKKKQSGEKTADSGLPKADKEKEAESESGKNPALDPPKDGLKGRKKRGKKSKTTIVKKTMKMIFVRGNNVVMIRPADADDIPRFEKQPAS